MMTSSDPDPLVDVLSVVPDALLDIRYAGAANVFGVTLYPFAAAFLRRSCALRLAAAAVPLRRRGLRLRIFDAYRPLSVQRRLWTLIPDPRYVADPRQGSAHNRGAAVDLALASEDGRALSMPSDFDDFSTRAAHDRPGASEDELSHARLLRRAMVGVGFLSLAEEWWHYSDPRLEDAPLLDLPFGDIWPDKT